MFGPATVTKKQNKPRRAEECKKKRRREGRASRAAPHLVPRQRIKEEVKVWSAGSRKSDIRDRSDTVCGIGDALGIRRSRVPYSRAPHGPCPPCCCSKCLASNQIITSKHPCSLCRCLYYMRRLSWVMLPQRGRRLRWGVKADGRAIKRIFVCCFIFPMWPACLSTSLVVQRFADAVPQGLQIRQL